MINKFGKLKKKVTSGHLPGLRPPGSDGGDGAGAWPGGARSRLAGWALLELPAPGSACLLGGGEGGRPPAPRGRLGFNLRQASAPLGLLVCGLSH